MYLLLNGPDRRELREILQSTFDRDGLRMALAESEPSRKYESLVKSDDFTSEVFEIIGVAEKEGWLDELIALVPLHTKRGDFCGRAQAVRQRAQERERQHGGGGAIGRLQFRFRLLTAFFFALGAMTLALGLMAYVFTPRIGIWSVPAGTLALAVMIIAAALYRRSEMESTDLALSPLPLIFLGVVAVTVVVNQLVLYKSMKMEPNLKLQLTEQSKPVPEQKVNLRSPAALDRSEEQITNINGEAFFTVLANRSYWGEFERVSEGKNCQTPAFFAEEQVTNRAYEIATLECSPSRSGQDDDILRTDDTSRIPSVDIRDLTLPVDPDARQARAPLGHPSAPLVLDRRFYSLGFNPQLRAATWVSFIVDEANTIAVQRRPRESYIPDPALPPEIQTSPQDYARNPYDIGTLIRRADAGYAAATLADAQLAENEAYYLSIVVPQPDNTNRLTWREVEELTGKLSRQHGKIHVFAGPIYKNDADANDSYLVVGPGKTLVPLFIYRVLLRKAADQRWRAIGFLVANDGSVVIAPELNVISVATIEAKTGLQFFPELPASEQAIKENTSLDVFAE